VQTAEVRAENDARVHTVEIGTCGNNEAELIKRILEGCAETFADLLRPHLKPVRTFVRNAVPNDFDADDLIQQTLFKAYTRLHQFRFQSSFRTWLTSIARNEIRQNARLRSKSRLVFDQGKSISVARSDNKDCPFEIYAGKETSHQLWHAVANLPTKYRLVIELSDLGGEESGGDWIGTGHFGRRGKIPAFPGSTRILPASDGIGKNTFEPQRSLV
jgi:RNA polymerase sigma factor (sigma-70 family)